jgi:uncharacterized protein
VKLDGCTALITGASAGIGREFARQLAERAKAVVLVARRRDRLEELRSELTNRKPGLAVHIYATDLSRDEDVEALGDALERDGVAIDFLINNAGLGDRGAFATSEPQRAKDITLVNMLSLTLLTRRLLPAMIERRRGAILNVSSSASFLPIPRMAVYAASKAYVTSLSEALRSEVASHGITVTALCPGPVHTEFDTVAMRPHDPRDKAPEFTYVPVEEVVRAALEGVERNRAIVVPGVAMKIGMLLVRLLPMPVLRAAMRLAP